MHLRRPDDRDLTECGMLTDAVQTADELADADCPHCVDSVARIYTRAIRAAHDVLDDRASGRTS